MNNKADREWMRGRCGESANAWKGDKAGYVAIHMWLTKHYEKEKCEHCGKTTKEAVRLEWANISGKYKREREDYLCLCTSCHLKMDLRKSHCKYGHKISGENLVINNRGHRICRACVSDRNRRYKEKRNAKNN